MKPEDNPLFPKTTDRSILMAEFIKQAVQLSEKMGLTLMEMAGSLAHGIVAVASTSGIQQPQMRALVENYMIHHAHNREAWRHIARTPDLPNGIKTHHAN